MIRDIWQSFRGLPPWVQVWIVLILVPVNLAALLFVDQPFGRAVAFLAVAGMVPNAFLIVIERGFSKAMSISHLVFWIPLLFLALGLVTGSLALSPGFLAYVWVLLLVDAVSLGFDLRDTVQWLRGDRAVAGRNGL